MIRVTSNLICKTAGSMMNQICGKNMFLQSENIEMKLKFNIGPLHPPASDSNDIVLARYFHVDYVKNLPSTLLLKKK